MKFLLAVFSSVLFLIDCSFVLANEYEYEYVEDIIQRNNETNSRFDNYDYYNRHF